MRSIPDLGQWRSWLCESPSRPLGCKSAGSRCWLYGFWNHLPSSWRLPELGPPPAVYSQAECTAPFLCGMEIFVDAAPSRAFADSLALAD
eukprot:294864-Amphidinium_carterae.1